MTLASQNSHHPLREGVSLHRKLSSMDGRSIAQSGAVHKGSSEGIVQLSPFGIPNPYRKEAMRFHNAF